MGQIATSRRQVRTLVDLSVAFLLGLVTAVSVTAVVKAATPDTAPPELLTTLEQIETAANRQDLDSLMEFYSPEFVSSDGLNAAELSEAIQQTWEKYEDLSYNTRLMFWQEQGDEIVAETITYINGTREVNNRNVELSSVIRARQHFQDQAIVRQEIISESTKITAGENPPQVQVNVPETVQIGEQFNFDVIVTEPLEDTILLGTAVEDTINIDRYLNPSTLELEILPAGGIYKIVTGPETSEPRWLSAIIVRGDGMTLVTERVTVKE